METIGFNDQMESKPQAAFIIFYSLETTPACLIVDRADGMLGFVGGMVENGESLNDAAIREAKEEIGHNVTAPLEPVVAHNIGHITTHAFMSEVSQSALRSLRNEASTGEHYSRELKDVFITELTTDTTEKLFVRWMASSVLEELVHFLLKKKIFTKEGLNEISVNAGFSLEELLK